MKKKCYFCGKNKKLAEHHIIPKSVGGGNFKKNKETICDNCHQKLHKLLDPVVNYLMLMVKYAKTGDEMKMKIGFIRTNNKKVKKNDNPDIHN